MKWFRRLSAFVILMMGLAMLKAADNSKINSLDGEWIVTAMVTDGENATEEELKGVRVKFDFANGKVSGKKGEKMLFQANIKVDASKDPHAIDVTTTSEGKRKGMTAVGIYAVDGDSLKTCIDETGKNRPTEFASKAGAGLVLREYRRADH